MISIKKKNNVTWINAAVTDFSTSIGYCDYKVPLSIEGIKPESSQAMITGTEAHEAEEKYEQEHMELKPVTIQEIKDVNRDIEFAREDIKSLLQRQFSFSGKKVWLSLHGQIDKISRKNGILLVQDDKFVGNPASYDKRKKPYDGPMLQVLAYLNSKYTGIGDISHLKKKWEIRICDAKTEKAYKTFSEIQDSDSLNWLETSLEKFAGLCIGSTEPVHHNMEGKCIPCGLRNSCDYRL